MTIYTPKKRSKPENLIDVPSAWKGLESIIGDILERFEIRGEKALEFGVEYGYSTVALSNFFKRVIGVDTFKGDVNTADKEIPDFYQKVKENLSQFDNILLYEESYQDYIKTKYMSAPFDLVHIDIVHNYEDTYAAGDWAMSRAGIVIFHDTESFPEVKRAVSDLATKYEVEFYNYPFNYGLGILCKKSRL